MEPLSVLLAYFERWHLANWQKKLAFWYGARSWGQWPFQGILINRRPFKRQLWLGLLIATTVVCIRMGQMEMTQAIAPSSPTPLVLTPSAQISTPLALSSSPQRLLDQGRSQYENGQLTDALDSIRAAVALYRRQENQLGEAVGLSNFALVQERLGNLDEATRAITISLDRLRNLEQNSYGRHERDRQSALAQSLNVQAQVLLAQGQPDSALEALEQATVLFDELGSEWGVIRSQIRQAEALQARGFHQDAIAVLYPIYETLQTQSSSPLKVSVLRNLATVYYQVGNLSDAESLITESLDLAQRFKLPQEIMVAQLRLGNIFRAQAAVAQAQGASETSAEKRKAALDAYQQTVQLDSDGHNGSLGLIGLQAQLNQFSLRIEAGETTIAVDQWQSTQAALARLPLSRAGLYAHINLAKTLMASKAKTVNAQSTTLGTLGTLDTPDIPDTLGVKSQIIDQELQYAQQQAYVLGDRRAESFALGYLGEWYELQYQVTQQAAQWKQATLFTQKALVLANQLDAQDMTYQWHWQMGRLLAAQSQVDEAIAAYQSAIQILDTLRIDLVNVNLEVQFSFQENIEPIHRELVNLLLKKDDLFKVEGNNSSSNIIKQAQKTIESLQLVELTNFLREACINLDTVDLEKVDQVLTQTNTAVVYPIILSDRLEIILSLPEQPSKSQTKQPSNLTSNSLSKLKSETEATSESLESLTDHSSLQTLSHVTVEITQADLERLMNDYYDSVYDLISLRYQSLAQKAYEVLMRPIEDNLASRNVDTLVFVLDGVLRNVPMAVLNDGEQFLVEKYSIALTPGIQLLPELLSSQSLNNEQLSVMALGLSEGRQGFLPLPNVEKEIEQIRKAIPTTQVLLNEEFTQENFINFLSASPSPIVHLATHGQFSSQQENTFVLTWDEKINVGELSQALRVGADRRQAPIELLVLSACQTASGDRRAALGLAGVAIRAGARSTVASLWHVDDAAAAEMMGEFYTQIAEKQVSKAEALRQAQLKILQNPQYRNRKHPYFWAPFVLVGNWL